jgi:hypothetical protein
MIPKKWLVEKLENIDAVNRHFHNNSGQNSRVAFQMKVQPKDEVWYFDSGKKSAAMLGGRAGYALVRNGEPIDAFVTRMG